MSPMAYFKALLTQALKLNIVSPRNSVNLLQFSTFPIDARISYIRQY